MVIVAARRVSKVDIGKENTCHMPKGEHKVERTKRKRGRGSNRFILVPDHVEEINVGVVHGEVNKNGAGAALQPQIGLLSDEGKSACGDVARSTKVGGKDSGTRLERQRQASTLRSSIMLAASVLLCGRVCA